MSTARKTSLLGRTLLAGLAGSATLLAGSPASDAINQLGIDLHRLTVRTHPDQNLLLSPYSIQSALAMTYAGADGVTKAEMAKVLHYPADEAALHAAFRELGTSLSQGTAASGGTISFNVANRLFGQAGFQFEKPFLGTVKDFYAAPLEVVDFRKSAAAITTQINRWVESQTQERIRDLIPPNVISSDTRLVLVNALYMKAPWETEFVKGLTKNRPFHLTTSSKAEVPTLHSVSHIGFKQFDGFKAVALPYKFGFLQFVAFVPDSIDGLPALEARLDAGTLAQCAGLPHAEVDLYLPKLKMQPDSMALGDALRTLGMKSAFDVPAGSADFSRMAPPKEDRLAISEVVHKTFLELDEKGTEAAAATAVIMARSSAPVFEKPKPVVVRVDRPFAFAIQHRETGACLFLGRVTDPRK